jgi:hypothetical protein
MSTRSPQRRGVAPSVLLIAGGALKIPLWVLFISLHGPTSYNEDRLFLGGDPLIWGALMSAVPSLLVVGGLAGHARSLGAPIARRVGLILALAALGIPALVDLATRALWPPLLVPALAAGALLIGATGRRDPRLPDVSRVAFLAIGVLLAAAFAFVLLTPLEVFDEIEGYRLQGMVEHVLVGLGWAAVGLGFLFAGEPGRKTAPPPIP